VHHITITNQMILPVYIYVLVSDSHMKGINALTEKCSCIMLHQTVHIATTELYGVNSLIFWNMVHSCW
jgi:hypothetical protein